MIWMQRKRESFQVDGMHEQRSRDGHALGQISRSALLKRRVSESEPRDGAKGRQESDRSFKRHIWESELHSIGDLEL